MLLPYQSRRILIGKLPMGGGEPIRLQSMTNTDTLDVEASLAQCIRMIKAGAELVRLTTQGEREVEALGWIREELRERGYEQPVVADIHFRPRLALEAAKVADKIRINPGNYLRGGEVEGLLPELIETCMEHGTAIRIGVNHGSLAKPILEKYGDTPRGMVESAMQFLRVCHQQGMDRVVVSMKSSNPGVMIRSVRLLACVMTSEEMDYPIHLGVTEAGDGPEGRIRSAVGIAPLLIEGLGDTLRVSLTEAPEKELPVARALVDLFSTNGKRSEVDLPTTAWDPYSFRRRRSEPFLGMGKARPVKIVSSEPPLAGEDLHPGELEKMVSYSIWENGKAFPSPDIPLLLTNEASSLSEVMRRLHAFCLRNPSNPVVYKSLSLEMDPDRYRLQLAGEMGTLLADGAVDAVWAENPAFSTAWINETLLTILQAVRARISRVEYIACPSCGRTHFDILARLKEIREATSHLEPVKIGVMGCIVNGPGEMADADYGYVGAGRGKVSIYRGREEVLRNIPEGEALEAMIGLLKKDGRWKDPAN